MVPERASRVIKPPNEGKKTVGFGLDRVRFPGGSLTFTVKIRIHENAGRETVPNFRNFSIEIRAGISDD